MTKAETKNGSNQTVVAYDYAYDPAKRLQSVTDSRGSKTLNYSWTPGGRLALVADSDGHQASMSYDVHRTIGQRHRPQRRDRQLRLRRRRTPGRDAAEQRPAHHAKLVRGWQSQAETEPVQCHSPEQPPLQPRPAGPARHQSETIGGTAKSWSYLYDNLDRLTSANDGTAETYGYDIFGNRRSKTKGSTTTAYLYDVAHQLSEVRSGSDTGTLIGAAVHDADGHMVKLCEVSTGGTVTKPTGDCTASGTGATTLALVWDALDHLNTATRTGVNAVAESYTYDDSGRRIQKTSGATTTSYLYDGDDIHAEWNGAISGNPAAVYVQGAGIDEPLLRLTGTTNGPGATQAAYLQDGLGSVVGLANTAGTLTANQRFDAWGNKTTSSGTIPQYGYSGREPDATGLEYFRARYQHPGLGRFVSRDPMGMADAVSGYAYVANSPTNLIDPMGLLSRNPAVVAGGNSCYYSGGCTMTDAQEEGYDFSNGPVNVAGGGRPPVQLRLPFGNYRPEPTIQNLGSMAQVRNIEQQIQRYNPSYRYSEISSSGYSQSSVNSAQATLTGEQQGFQARIDQLASTMPSIRANQQPIAITRALNPETGNTVDLVSQAGGTLRPEVARALRPGEIAVSGFSSHAEQNGIAYAESRGLVPLVSGSNIRICPSCQEMMLNSNVLPGSRLKPGGPLFDLFGGQP